VGVVAPGAKQVALPSRRIPRWFNASRSAPAMPPRLHGRAAGHRGPVLVVYADAPLVTTATLQRLVEACRKAKAIVVCLASPRRTEPYGRLITRATCWKDRRKSRCRCEGEGHPVLQFRRGVHRRRADCIAAGRDRQ